MSSYCFRTGMAAAALVTLALLGTARAAILSIERVSENSKGIAGFSFCNDPVISGNGRFVAFVSDSNNLVPGDSNNNSDIFVKDLVSNTIEIVSRNNAGQQGNFSSSQPSISADGRYVCFLSVSNNLVPADVSGNVDAFVRDRQAQTIVQASVRSDGSQVPTGLGETEYAVISGNGRVVAFQHDADMIGPEFSEEPGGGVYVRELASQSTQRVAFQADGDDAVGGIRCAISEDGRMVAFDSQDNGIVPGDPAPNADIYVVDRQSGNTRWVSEGINDSPLRGHSILRGMSSDGQYVSFEADHPNLVNGDTNGVSDVFLRNVPGNNTVRVSVGPGGLQGNDFSGDGADVSADGRFVTFSSAATNLIAGDTNEHLDVFVRDLEQQTTERISLREDGSQALSFSVHPDMSDDGRIVVFQSPGDFVGPNNNIGQVYAVELGEEVANRPPVANAPSDQTIKTKAAKAKVKLDGSGSSDPDKDKLTFRWLEGKTEIATGVRPTVKLKKGAHTITLEVRDPEGLTDTDEVTITVKKKRR